MKTAFTLALVAAAFLTSTPHAEAADPCSPYLGGSAYSNIYGLFSPYSGSEHIPYFAKHPPVYYSYPVPRPYGWSPYAYPPGTMTPELDIELIEPAIIENPHVPQSQTNAEPDATAAARPQIIINPFVEQAESAMQLAAESRD